MGEDFVLTDETAKTLKCSLCGYYLSIPPISIISEDATKYKCGRCHSIKTHIETKVVMYENLAKFMRFPCIYKRCNESLKWGTVRDHERKCAYRTIACPKAGCDDELLVSEFTSHFKERHREAFHTNKLLVRNVHNYYSLDVLVKDDKAYVIIFDYDDSKYGVSVCSLEPDDRQYEFIINSEVSKYSIVCTAQNIIPFDKRIHCFKCVTGVCRNEAHFYRYYKKGILKRMTTKVDRDAMKRAFGGMLVNYAVNIVEPKPHLDEDLEDLIVEDMIIDEVNDEEEEGEMSKDEDMMRHMLECPNCFEYMQPPIYQCVTGHTTCKKCKDSLTKCPTCEAAIANIRNLALEEAANNLKISSLIAEKGTPIGAEDKTVANEITCPRVNCNETYELKSIGTHFKEKHVDNFHWNSVTIKNVYTYFNIDVLVRYGKTYVVIFDYNEFNFAVTICSIHEHEEDMYEVKLMSENGKFSIVATDQKIVPFDELEHCAKCLSGTCQNNRHKFWLKRKLIFKRMSTKFNRDSVNRTFNHSVLHYVINIIECKKVFSKDFQLKKDKIFRQMYHCPACKYFMTPPIQQCLTGHSFCKPCLANLEECPVCEAQMAGTRNYILEEMSESIELACQADADKCEFKASIKRMASHKAECPANNKKVRLDLEEAEEVTVQETETETNVEAKEEAIQDTEEETIKETEEKVQTETTPETSANAKEEVAEETTNEVKEETNEVLEKEAPDDTT